MQRAPVGPSARRLESSPPLTSHGTTVATRDRAGRDRADGRRVQRPERGLPRDPVITVLAALLTAAHLLTVCPHEHLIGRARTRPLYPAHIGMFSILERVNEHQSASPLGPHLMA